MPGLDLLTTRGHERVLSSCWYRNVCLAERSGDRKVVYHFGMRPLEVFDLAQDPGELADLAPELDGAEIREAEERLLGAKLSIDAFWAQHPVQPVDDEVKGTLGSGAAFDRWTEATERR